MKGKPFTIQTYFPNGNPRSIQISHVPTRTVQSILIPRDDLKEAISLREELNYNGYIFYLKRKDTFKQTGKHLYILEKVKM